MKGLPEATTWHFMPSSLTTPSAAALPANCARKNSDAVARMTLGRFYETVSAEIYG
jgi:hypothetical protein